MAHASGMPDEFYVQYCMTWYYFVCLRIAIDLSLRPCFFIADVLQQMKQKTCTGCPPINGEKKA